MIDINLASLLIFGFGVFGYFAGWKDGRSRKQCPNCSEEVKAGAEPETTTLTATEKTK